MPRSNTTKIRISKEVHIAKAVYEAHTFAADIGFNVVKQNMIATAVSELARNIFVYALKGEIIIKKLDREGMKGIQITAQDEGGGIQDIGLAMKDNYSTGDTLGLGLPGVKRLMDEFSFDDKRKIGTKITVKKWL